MVTHRERMAKLPKERRERIEKKAKELHQEYLLIKRLREEANLTQKELEEKTGISQSVLSKLENGNRRITLASISKVISSLGGEWELTVQLPNKKKQIVAASKKVKQQVRA